ncbi:MAG: type I pullulanase [Acutalibacteraceae bacterium]
MKKIMALLLSAVMLGSVATTAVSAAETGEEPTGAGNYYNRTFLEDKTYMGSDLGCTYTKEATTFKVWAPNASSVQVKLYKTGSDNEAGAGVIGTYDMTKSDNVWSVKLDGDHVNQYYTYLVKTNAVVRETQDVYSRAVGVNGNRSMVVDLDSTDPEGWENDKHVLFDNPSQAAVWEVHVRDFTIDSSSGISTENKGKYLGFTEGGSKLNGKKTEISTGIDYLVEQGINCVQIMPVYDFGSVDETKSGGRNWGYDPVNYNVPEGSYSTNPYDGNVRITEFKQMIQALHNRGISVIMDVVYNHTYTTEGSCFEKTVPGYYFRKTNSTGFSNGSGCGNETASDKTMYRQYMIDSVKYWASEYHIDGFRFDLMGLHDIPTMNQIRSALDNLYADGSGKKIIMYGEPWTGGTTPITDGCKQSLASQLDARVGMFCDSYRDGIKGGTNDATKGFVQGNTSSTSKVVNGVQGKGFSAKAPAQTIAYADAHDNLILWDKIVKSNGSSSWTSTSESFKSQLKEALTLVMTSQGIPFITAGTEFCRTKKGDHNSYNSSDAINGIDWERAKTYGDVAAYYKGLLQIRENFAPMAGSGFNTPSFQSSSGNVVAYTYTNSNTNQWGKVCVIVNSGVVEANVNLGSSGWTVVADGTKAGLTSLGTVSGSTYTVLAKGSAILVETATFARLKAEEEKFGTLTTEHYDENGNLVKSATAKYKAGTTYRAMPDTTLLYDNNIERVEGTVSGTVVADTNTTVKFYYKSTGIKSGYLTVKYVNEKGATVAETYTSHLRDGDLYQLPSISIQGYQLDTDNFPAESYGTFDGNDKTVTFKYKMLDSTTTTVHYYNSKNWGDVRCYSYTDSGKNLTGTWDTAKLMTSEGNGWFVIDIPAGSCYAMFHPSTGKGTGQEPGQGEPGYPVSGEVWIKNGTITFNCKLVTSHIDVKTGKKLVEDEVQILEQKKSSESYKTSAKEELGTPIVPLNANGKYAAGVTNVVYLYADAKEPVTEPTTAEPSTAPSTEPTTAPTTPSTAPTTEMTTAPTTPSTAPTTEPSTPTTTPTAPSVDEYLVGDVDGDGSIKILDATLIQKHVASIITLSKKQLLAADCEPSGKVDIKDATTIQRYVAGIATDTKVGTVEGGGIPTPTEQTEPTTLPATEPATTEPTTTAPVTEPTEPTTTTPATEPTTAEPVTEPTTEEPTTEPDTDPIFEEGIIRFTNSQGWGTVYAYFFNSEDFVGAVWPGEQMTYYEDNPFGQQNYEILIPEGAESVVFSDGNGTQTVDLPLAGVIGYYLDGTQDYGKFNGIPWDPQAMIDDANG